MYIINLNMKTLKNDRFLNYNFQSSIQPYFFQIVVYFITNLSVWWSTISHQTFYTTSLAIIIFDIYDRCSGKSINFSLRVLNDVLHGSCPVHTKDIFWLVRWIDHAYRTNSIYFCCIYICTKDTELSLDLSKT